MKHETALITIDNIEIDVIVYYDFDQGQKEILNPVDISCEGIDPSIEITSINSYICDVDISYMFDNVVLRDLEESLLQDILQQQNDFEPDYESMLDRGC